MQGFSRRKVFIRTDANPVIASGHVMRCLSIADALRVAGAEAVFVTSDDNPRDLIEGRGFQVISLGTDWRDISEGLRVLRTECEREVVRPIVLIDTYSVTRGFVDAVAGFADACYLGSKDDDLGNLALLVNYSTRIDRNAYEAIYGLRGTRLLLGASYAPLRTRFSEMYRERDGLVRHVLLTTGSTDPKGFVPAFLNAALAEKSLSGISWEVVVGGMFPHGGDIEPILSGQLNVCFHRDVRDMAPLMAECDAAVSANGTTVYELSAMGLPSVTFAMVDEQRESAESLASLGAVSYAGALSDGFERVISQTVSLIKDLVATPDMAAALARRAHSLIDGRGAERIAKEMLSL